MANSDCISIWKNKILSELQSNDLFLTILDTTEQEKEDLVYKRLFPFYYIPQTITNVTTFVCIEVSINSTSRNKIYAYPRITINILTHQDHMCLSLAGVSKTRADYLSEIIDEIFNNATGYGYGRLNLISNTAGSLDSSFRYRQLVFEGKDINDNLCRG